LKVETFVDVMHQTLWLMGLLSAPVLVSSLVLGVGIGIVQVVTSIQEQTLSFVPKLILALLILALTLPWMLSTLLDYSQQTFVRLQTLG
jgi:flagellar biosynthesis protein FliQ